MRQRTPKLGLPHFATECRQAYLGAEAYTRKHPLKHTQHHHLPTSHLYKYPCMYQDIAAPEHYLCHMWHGCRAALHVGMRLHRQALALCGGGEVLQQRERGVGIFGR